MSPSSPGPRALPNWPCYLDGAWTPLNEARVSVLDRGFIFGDAIYEVVPVYAGHPFRFEHHLARLERSLAELRIPSPLSHAQWREVADKLVAGLALALHTSPEKQDCLVYMQVTRGVAMRDHAMVPGLKPTVFAMCNPMTLPGAAARSGGVACVTAADFRWEKAHIKTTSLLGAVFARQMAVEAGAVETIMFRQGFLSEASSSNVWVVKDGRVAGPLKDNLVLQGIRYGLIEEICKAEGIPFELRRITREEVMAADELLLSSATKEVLPVTRLDGAPVGKGLPGPIYKHLHAAYERAKLEETR
ncbi:MAG: aminotransferase class IV [Burkholderiaceae bacterium]